jgi:hypothetical protein
MFFKKTNKKSLSKIDIKHDFAVAALLVDDKH